MIECLPLEGELSVRAKSSPTGQQDYLFMCRVWNLCGLHLWYIEGSTCVSLCICVWESKLRPHAYINTLLAELSFLEDHLAGHQCLKLPLLRTSSTVSES